MPVHSVCLRHVTSPVHGSSVDLWAISAASGYDCRSFHYVAVWLLVLDEVCHMDVKIA